MKNVLRSNAPLFAVVALAAVPILRVGAAQSIDYDGWIHLFVSRAESLRTFHADWHKTTQPPLFFLLLKALSFLGSSRLAYRCASIVSALVAIFVLGKIAERTTSSRIVGVLAAAAFGFSTTTLILACEVRSYMPAIALMLIALHYALAMILRGGRKAALLFGAAVIAGILTLYSAVFFWIATVLALFVTAVLSPEFRVRLTRWTLPAVLAAPAVIVAAAYWHHMSQWGHALNYMPEFYFDRTRDRWPGFLLNGLRQEAGLFSPIAVTSAPLALFLVIIFAAAAVAALIMALRARDIPTALPILVLLFIAAEMVGAALLGKYPLGGQLRHQSLLFPFILLSLASIGGMFLRRVPRNGVRHAVVLAAAVLIAANAITGSLRFPIVRGALFENELRKFRTVVPPSTLLYLDEFSTIAFFSHHYAWRWHLAASDSIHTLYYEVTKGRESMRVVRVRNEWNFRPFEEDLYRDLRLTMELHRARSAGLFALGTIPAGMSAEEARSRVARAAATQRLNVEGLLVDGANLYVRLSETP